MGNGPVEIVDLPINSMVDLSIVMIWSWEYWSSQKMPKVPHYYDLRFLFESSFCHCPLGLFFSGWPWHSAISHLATWYVWTNFLITPLRILPMSKRRQQVYLEQSQNSVWLCVRFLRIGFVSKSGSHSIPWLDQWLQLWTQKDRSWRGTPRNQRKNQN